MASGDPPSGSSKKIGGGLPLVLVQGGTLDALRHLLPDVQEGVKRAALRGYQVLMDTKCALEAAEAACVVLENDPAFNAGIGSHLNSAGEVEMGACIMDGSSLRSGGVAIVNCVPNPISLARKVMTHSDCAIIASQGARKFAEGLGLQTVPEEQLRTPQAQEALEEFKRKQGKQSKEEKSQETVGVVVVDSQGRVASASSTGGRIGRHPGRISGSPLPGSNTYCDNAIGGVACSGRGESIIMYNLSQRILNSMKNGMSAEEAAVEGLCGLGRRYGSPAGAVAASSCGEVGVAFTSDRMPWACLHSGQMHFGLLPGQHLLEPLSDLIK